MGFVDPKDIVKKLGIEPGMEIADFGVGAGYYAVLLAEAVGDKGRVYAVDILEEVLTKAKSHDHGRHDNIEFLLGDLEQQGGSGLGDNQVDMVLISNTLFQFENKPAGLAEAHRVLRSGGALVLIDWSDSFGGLGPHDDNILPENDAKLLCEAANFTYVKNIDAGDHHYGLVYKK